MHEMSLFKGILSKIKALSHEHQDKKIKALTIRLGALSHMSASHFQEHFDVFSKGTAAEGALLKIIEDGDDKSPQAQGIVLESVDIEVDEH